MYNLYFDLVNDKNKEHHHFYFLFHLGQLFTPVKKHINALLLL
jgi:hypothetical protein